MPRHICDKCRRTYYGHKRKVCKKCRPPRIKTNNYATVTKDCLHCGEWFRGTANQKYHNECAKIVQKQREKVFAEKEAKFIEETTQEQLSGFVKRVIDPTCYNCQKYPLCTQYQELIALFDKNRIMKYTTNVFGAIATDCNYYAWKQDG